MTDLKKLKAELDAALAARDAAYDAADVAADVARDDLREAVARAVAFVLDIDPDDGRASDAMKKTVLPIADACHTAASPVIEREVHGFMAATAIDYFAKCCCGAAAIRGEPT